MLQTSIAYINLIHQSNTLLSLGGPVDRRMRSQQGDCQVNPLTWSAAGLCSARPLAIQTRRAWRTGWSRMALLRPWRCSRHANAGEGYTVAAACKTAASSCALVQPAHGLDVAQGHGCSWIKWHLAVGCSGLGPRSKSMTDHCWFPCCQVGSAVQEGPQAGCLCLCLCWRDHHRRRGGASSMHENLQTDTCMQQYPAFCTSSACT